MIVENEGEGGGNEGEGRVDDPEGNFTLGSPQDSGAQEHSEEEASSSADNGGTKTLAFVQEEATDETEENGACEYCPSDPFFRGAFKEGRVE